MVRAVTPPDDAFDWSGAGLDGEPAARATEEVLVQMTVSADRSDKTHRTPTIEPRGARPRGTGRLEDPATIRNEVVAAEDLFEVAVEQFHIAADVLGLDDD